MQMLAQGYSESGVLAEVGAMVVSTVLLAYEVRDEGWFDASELAEFVTEFVGLVKEQVKKGLDYDREARDICLTSAEAHVDASIGRATSGRAARQDVEG